MKSTIFLNFQIENQKSDRQKFLSDSSERIHLKYSVKLNVLCCEKNSDPTWVYILSQKMSTSKSDHEHPTWIRSFKSNSMEKQFFM